MNAQANSNNASPVENRTSQKVIYADFLPDARYLSAREHSLLARPLLGIIILFVIVALGWASLSQVEQAVLAPGQVRPIDRVNVINHPEGGSVTTIYIREGDRVVAGEPLLALDDTLIAAEFERLTGEWRALAAQVSRLEAEAQDRETILFPPALQGVREDLMAAERQLFKVRQEALATRRQVSQQVIAQRQSELATLTTRLQKQRASLKLLIEQEAAIAKLAAEGLYPTIQHLSVQRELNDLRGDFRQVEQERVTVQAALAEAQNQLKSLDKDWLEQVLTELSQRRTERDAHAARLRQEASRLQNLIIRAPVSGTVQRLQVHNLGQAVGADEPLMNLVPQSAQLIIEARVASSDIGFVEVGQPATVKVRTYDFIKFGTLAGRVEQMAADATEDPQTREVTYTVTIKTAKTHLGEHPGEQPVAPGMLVDVELKTGERSVLSYLTDRLMATADAAFKER